jgi:hypothetical protein
MGEEELPGGARPSHPHTLRGRLPPTLTPGRSPRARTSRHVAPAATALLPAGSRSTYTRLSR